MAERRMFAKSIITSTKFLMMSATARLLYYDLGMRADDDGVVEAYGVMRETGAREDDLNALVAKGFITVMNQDEWVIYITAWKTNNQIRPDRYRKGLHHDLLVSLLPEAEISFKKKNSAIPAQEPPPSDDTGLPVVYQVDTDGKPSIGKVSIGKERKGNSKTPVGADELLQSIDLSTATKDQVDALTEAVIAFCTMRKHQRKPLDTQRAVQLLRGKLYTLSGGNVDMMIALLDQSVERGWLTVYALKADYTKSEPAQQPAPTPTGRRMVHV